MFKNHLKIAFRQLSRNKVFSTLNILGLSLGITLAILIFTFIQQEFTYDKWMPDSENTYRIYRSRGNNTSWTPPQLAFKVAADYPEVIAASGFAPSGEKLIAWGEKEMYIEETANIDSTFFSVLQMEFLSGDPATAMDQPNSLVVTDKLAEKIFGRVNPIGEIVKYDGGADYVVTGVLNTKNKNTHISSQLFTRFLFYGNSWSGNNRATYTRLKQGSNPLLLAKKIDKDLTELITQEHLTRNYTPNPEDLFRWHLQPLEDIYLHSTDFTAVMNIKGNMRNIYLFGIIAFLVLFVAIINYVNLTTARASQRSKEVGVKKVAGAGRGELTLQFISESILQAFLAGTIALLIAEISLPFFNNIMDRELKLFSGNPGLILSVTMFLSVLVGLVAGSYPAFIMSGFKPTAALKSTFMKSGDKGILRKVLVTGQFATSIVLLIVMSFIYRQVNYMMNQGLGFQPDQVVKIPMTIDSTYLKVSELKSRFKQIPGVQEVTTASRFPGDFLPDWPVFIEGRSDRVIAYVMFSDQDFAKSLNIEMVKGRFIDDNIEADQSSNYIVNETFVKTHNIENPIGLKMKFEWQEEYGQIVGVMKDFHHSGLANEIEPILMNALDWRSEVGIKLSTTDLPQTIASIEKLWQDIEPDHPMRYSFLDEDFAAQYEEQQRFGKAILYASLLTIFIALLGLFGLTVFTVERRTKEIGIRKILGSSASAIVGLLAKDFIKLISLACLVALPAGYYLSNEWLTSFAHRTDLAWYVFAGSGLLILLLGVITVSILSFRAAFSNPVDNLRSE